VPDADLRRNGLREVLEPQGDPCSATLKVTSWKIVTKGGNTGGQVDTSDRKAEYTFTGVKYRKWLYGCGLRKPDPTGTKDSE
jgi:hypothetical protein